METINNFDYDGINRGFELMLRRRKKEKNSESNSEIKKDDEEKKFNLVKIIFLFGKKISLKVELSVETK